MLSIKELKHLQLLSQSGSLAEAANRAGLSASAISQSLTGIEAKLGMQLFIRRKGMLEITPAGRTVLVRVQRTINEVNALESDIDAMNQGGQSMVRFGIGPALSSLLLEPVLEELHELPEPIFPRFRVKFWDDCEGMLLCGDIDLFVGGFPAEANDDRFVFEPFYTDRLIAVARKDHPIFEVENPRFPDLIRFPVLASDTRHFTQWRALETVDDLDLFNRNVPGSVMTDTALSFGVVGKTDHIALVAEKCFLSQKDAHPELAMVPVEDLRGTAHMYFVSVAGVELPASYQVLVGIFKRALLETGFADC